MARLARFARLACLSLLAQCARSSVHTPHPSRPSDTAHCNVRLPQARGHLPSPVFPDRARCTEVPIRHLSPPAVSLILHRVEHCSGHRGALFLSDTDHANLQVSRLRPTLCSDPSRVFSIRRPKEQVREHEAREDRHRRLRSLCRHMRERTDRYAYGIRPLSTHPLLWVGALRERRPCAFRPQGPPHKGATPASSRL